MFIHLNTPCKSIRKSSKVTFFWMTYKLHKKFQKLWIGINNWQLIALRNFSLSLSLSVFVCVLVCACVCVCVCLSSVGIQKISFERSNYERARLKRFNVFSINWIDFNDWTSSGFLFVATTTIKHWESMEKKQIWWKHL